VKRVGLLAGLLVLTLGSGAMAQEPSPPPWFGGRVEMPEHGFAVTVPADWVTFDTAVDAVSQLEAASGVLDPVVWPADGAELLGVLATAGSEDMQLLSSHATTVDLCWMGAQPAWDMPIDEVADSMFESYLDDPSARDVEAPQRIDLPAGPAYLIRSSDQDDSGVWGPSSMYLLDADPGVLMTYCSTKDARPEDDWLSIVETIEFLPAEE